MNNLVISNSIKEFNVKGIDMICNLDNGTMVGFDNKGREVWALLKENKLDAIKADSEMTDIYNELLNEGFIKMKDVVEDKESEKLSSAYVHLTNRCNLNCKGCYSLDDNRNRCKDLSLDQVKNILRELSDGGVERVVLSGGEPLLRKDILEILKYRKEETNIKNIDMITNGMLVTNEVCERIKGYIDSIAVSIDGYSEEKPTFIRDNGIFSSVIRGVETIRDSGIQVSILPTLHSKNAMEMRSYIELSEKLNVGISYSLLTCDAVEFEDMLLKENHLNNIVDVMMGLDKKVVIDDSPLNFNLNVGSSCGICKSIVSVAADGEVYPCHMLHRDELKLGNINEKSLKEILSTSKKCEELSNLNVENFNECKDCDYRYICSGGCRARAYLTYKNFNEKDSYCTMHKLYFDRLMDSIVKHEINK